MNPHDLIRVALEAVVAAELSLFAAFLLLDRRSTGPVRLILAALGTGVGYTMLSNALGSAGVLPWLRVPNLFIELAFGPLILLFTLTAAGAPLERRHLVHAIAPVIGATLPHIGLAALVDPFVILALAGYLVAAAFTAVRLGEAFQPRAVQTFVWTVIAVFAAMLLLRAAIIVEAHLSLDYRRGAAYPALLALLVMLSSGMLLLGLRDPAVLMAIRQPAKYGGEALDEDEMAALDAALTRLIEVDHIYLKPAVTLADAARRLGVAPRQLSQAINARHGRNFPALLNEKRVDKAAELLRLDADIPITTLMYAVGFGSKTAFLREISRRFAVTPSDNRAGRPVR